MLIRLHLLPFSLLAILAAARPNEAGPYTNSSAPAKACNSCTVTAYEAFYTYPTSVEVTSMTVTNNVIPYVTIHEDGRSETNYKTETPQPTGPAPSHPPDKDPFAKLTWVVRGSVTLTYPTTYVEFYDMSGGTFYPVPNAVVPTCAYKDEELQLPSDSASGLIVPVTESVDVDAPHAVSAPPAVFSYLNGIPAVSSQFGGTDVGLCSWTKIPGAAATTSATNAVPVQKVSVNVLTEVTANQVVITRGGGGGGGGVVGGGDGNRGAVTSPAAARVEDPNTALIVPGAPNPTPPPNNGGTSNNNNNQQAQQQNNGGQGQNQPSPGGVVGNAVNNPEDSNNANANANSAAGNNTPNDVPQLPGGANNGGSGANGGSGTTNGGQSGAGSGSSGTGNGSGSGTGSGSGSGSSNNALPAPLVVVLGGSQTTVSPTVFSRGGSAVTAFVLGDETLVVGGLPVTVSGSVVSAPSAGTTDGVGDAIASGMGYTGPLATDAASFAGPNISMWLLAVFAGVSGALAVAL